MLPNGGRQLIKSLVTQEANQNLTFIRQSFTASLIKVTEKTQLEELVRASATAGSTVNKQVCTQLINQNFDAISGKVLIASYI